MRSLRRLPDQVVSATISLGDLVTGDHSWYARMKPADRRAYALMGYGVFGVAFFSLLGLAVLIVASLFPIFQQAPVSLLILLLFGAALVCLLMFMVTSVVGLIAMIARSRPTATKAQPAGQPRASMSLRRMAAFAFGFDALLVAPMVLTRQVPAFFLLLFIGPVVLFILSFVRTKSHN